MKITICGSVKFADKLVKIYKELKKSGHEPLMHKDMFGIANGSAQELIDGISLDHGAVKKKHNFIQLGQLHKRVGFIL